MFAGYQTERLLYHSGPTRVVRALNRAGDSVVIKAADHIETDPRKTAELRHEHRVLCHLEPDAGLPTILDFVEEGNSLGLVMEDVGGEDLAKRMTTAPDGLPVPELLCIATELARVVGLIHDQGVVHKDINPRNVVRAESSGRIQLVDFGISSRLGREQQAITLDGRLVASVPYMSPEQTGRMNLALDYRSDLYSLGVTLFHLITGRLPFEAKDYLGWVYQHMAVPPPNPCDLRTDVPGLLGAVVLKLLEKEPLNRYQSAAGLVADLERIEDGTPFEPGDRDVRTIFQLSQRLYGREAEVQRLGGAYEAAAQGGCVLVTVCGPSGIGKSAVVRELHKQTVRTNAWFAESKFEQFQRQGPHGALIGVCSALAQQLLARPKAEFEHHRELLDAALGDNAQVLARVVPRLVSVFGDGPKPPALGPLETRARVNFALSSFLRVLATRDHPVVLFLDDLQWADAASLEFLTSVLAERSIPHILVIGAYRNTETNESHPWSLARATIQRTNPFESIELGPLEQRDIVALIADTLQYDEAAAWPLAEQTFSKTRGNPFFVRRFLSESFRAGDISFSNQRRRWIVDLSAINARQASDNIVDFLIAELKRLPPETREILQYAACFGTTFDLLVLCEISGRSPEQCRSALWPALENSLLIPLTDGYKFIESALPKRSQVAFRFQHDRIQEAATESLPTDRRANLHARVGKALFKACPSNQLRARSIEIVAHWNAAESVLSSPEDRKILRDLNWEAAQQAKSSGAYTTALDYLNRTDRELTPDSWKTDYGLCRELGTDRVRAMLLSGDHQSAIALNEELVREAKTPVERAESRATMVGMFTVAGQHDRAIAEGLRGLAELGIEVPADPPDELLASALARALELVKATDLKRFADQPEVTDQAAAQACRLYEVVQAPLHLNGEIKLFTLTQLRGCALTLERGVTQSTPSLLAALGQIAISRLVDYELGRQLGEAAVALEDRYWGRRSAARTYFQHAAFLSHWGSTPREVEALLNRSIEVARATGDFEICGYSITMIALNLIHYSELGASMPIVRGYTEASRTADARSQWNIGRLIESFALALQGKTEHPLSLNTPSFDADVAGAQMGELKHSVGVALYHFLRLQLRFLAGDYVGAFNIIEEIDFSSTRLSRMHAKLKLFGGLVCAAAYPDIGEKQRATASSALNDAIEFFEKLARIYPENYGAHYHLLQAERARLDGEHRLARQEYDNAIVAVQVRPTPEIYALVYECSARYRAVDDAAYAGLLARHALQRWAAWGATLRVRQLRKEFSQELATADALFSVSANASTGPLAQNLNATSTLPNEVSLDLDAVLKAGRALSQEVVLDRLLRTLLRIVQENAGATKVVLVVRHEQTDAWVVEAERRGDRTTVGGNCRVEQATSLSPEVVSLVIRTEQEVLIHDAAADERLSESAYARSHGLRSLLCIPIVRQGSAIAILYLENNSTRGAFAADRTSVLRVLLGQIAIALTNARLYDTLEQKVARRTAQLQTKTDEVRAILENIQQGIFTIGPDGKIEPEYSKYLEKIYQRCELAGEDAAEVLFSNTTLSQGALSQASGMLEMLVGASSIEYSVNQHVLVSECQTRSRPGNPGKILEFDWSPIIHDDIVVKLMVVVKDVTEIRRLRAEANSRERDLDVLVRLVGQAPQRVQGFIAEARALINDTKARVTRRNEDQASAAALRRNYHTLKGGARLLQWEDLAELGYEGQETYGALVESDTAEAWDHEALARMLERTDAALVAYERVYAKYITPLVELGTHGDEDLSAAIRQMLDDVDPYDPAAAQAFIKDLKDRIAPRNAA